MANKWLTHVKHTMKTMKNRGTYKKGDGLKKVILEAKKSYKKHKGGADDAAPQGVEVKTTAAPDLAPAATGGRRKRGTRRTRRHRK